MKSFESIVTNPLLKKTIDEMGFKEPTAIQAEGMPILLGPATDFIGLAATGTGKTAAFGIPMLQRIESPKTGVQGLILCPTRELAMQVAGQINLMGKYVGARALAIYGGSSFSEQIGGLKRGASIVVGTPGRIVDHIKRETLNLTGVHTIVLDEADEMISMGFKEDLEAILNAVTKEKCNTWLFSATMSPGVRKVANTYLKNPRFIQVNRTEVLSQTVEQYFYIAREANKPQVLCKIIEAAEAFYGIIFCQTKALVVDLSRYLMEQGYKLDNLHGDKEQRAREITIKAFLERKTNILVCTDVAARGLDVKDVSHVINYSIPRELDSYVHRIGRTARSGQKGIALSLVSPSQRHMIARLEKITRSKIKEAVIPTRKEIGIKKVNSLFSIFKDQKVHGRVSELLNEDWKAALSQMSQEEVASRFIAMKLSDLFEDKKKEATPTLVHGENRQRPSKREREKDRSHSRKKYFDFRSNSSQRSYN